MKALCSMGLSELESKMQAMGEMPFRARQVFDWIYRQKAAAFGEMTNLSQELRRRLAQSFLFPSVCLIEKQESEETVKFLWKLADGLTVESVLIESFARRTVCLSTMVGCGGRCAFCASGKSGLIRRLSAAEIVEQAVQIDRMLAEKSERVSHLVYMGMGEPLENFDAVMQSIRILNAKEGMNISARRITVSTVGIVGNIRRLAGSPCKINLALSLHAPNQELRQKIIPYARKYPLDEILAAMDDYAASTKRDITFEYTLIENFNDRPEHARELAALLKGRPCTVNLIPYNPIEGLRFQRPDKSAIVRFRDILESEGINVTWRYTKGDAVSAACGQLALKKLTNSKAGD